jgi:DNA-binding transcriptional LysR family regulator
MDLLAQMATFVAVIDGNSLSAAGRRQRLSLPAVSRQLRALEADLGASLIVRSTRRLKITDAGRLWYEHCVRLLKDLESARAAVRGTKSVRGTLVVSASFTFGSAFIVPRLSKLSERYPELGIDLRLEDRLSDLVGEGVDVAVRAGPPPPDSTAFIAHALLTMRRVLVASPRWLRKRGALREPRQLARVNCLIQVTPAGSVVQWALGCKDELQTIEARGSLRSSAPTALLDLAIDGAGVAYLPEFLVKEALAQRRLRRVLPEWSSPPITAWAVHRSELKGAPRLRAFLDAIQDVASARS